MKEPIPLYTEKELSEAYRAGLEKAMKIQTKNAPAVDANEAVEDAMVEGFLAGAMSERENERNRLYEALVDAETILVDFVEYISVEDVLKLIRRGL